MVYCFYGYLMLEERKHRKVITVPGQHLLTLLPRQAEAPIADHRSTSMNKNIFKSGGEWLLVCVNRK